VKTTRKRETLAAMITHVKTEGRDMVNIILKTDVLPKGKGMERMDVSVPLQLQSKTRKTPQETR
jgi:hypothetical protein